MTRIWNLLCSLKLAIVLASLATVTIMLGSLWMPGHMQLFGQLDSLILGAWLQGPGANQFALSWWVYFACGCLALFGLNTLCCFIDWLRNVKARWRKSGEYLLHLGFCLMLAAYIWGSFSGTRSQELAIPLGATRPVPNAPGYYLQLERFEPQIDASGRPLDFPQRLNLHHGDTRLTSQQVRLNQPLIWHDIVVIPSSYRQRVDGFQFVSAENTQSVWRPGNHFNLPDGALLEVLDFFPHVVRQPSGRIQPLGEQLGNPAFLLQIKRNDHASWKGWYLLREGLPEQVRKAGLNLRPLAPLTSPVSLLTISFDPGAPLAAAGGALMALGSCLALFSYYAKRRRGEHPEVA